MCTNNNFNVSQVDKFNESLFRNSTKNAKFADFNSRISDFLITKK